MNKGIGATSKRNRIANYMDALPEEFEVLEDDLGSNNPSIKLQTKNRIINLVCDDKGKVIEEFQMREGAETKESYMNKQEAYCAINSYYEDYYTGAKIIKNSFDEGELIIELNDKTVTLKYDSKTNSVDEKDSIKRKTKPKESKLQESTKSNEKKGSSVIKEQEYTQLSLFDIVKSNHKESGYDKWTDGMIVKNVCNNKKYKVKHDNGNTIEVFDEDYGYLIMARADLKIVDTL